MIIANPNEKLSSSPTFQYLVDKNAPQKCAACGKDDDVLLIMPVTTNPRTRCFHLDK
jgi:hypothetical protein